MARLNKTPLTLRVRRGTVAQITATSPAPYQKEGELAYATDTGGFYISDGTQFNLLASGLQDLQSVTDVGNITTNPITTEGVTSPYYLLDTTATPTPQQGMLFWDEDRSTVGLQMNGVEARLGQDNFWYVKNQTGSPIPKGTAVMAVGALGASSRILVAPMVADGSVDEQYFLGITAEEILNGEDGFVTNIGKIRGIDTSVYGTQAGQILYCDPANPGGFTITQPQAPNLNIPAAFTVDYKNNGTIAVRALPGYHLSELHDVYINTPSDQDILLYNGTNNRWENTPLASAVPTPTLQTVTDAGNTTTNDIVINNAITNVGLLFKTSTNAERAAFKINWSSGLISIGGTGAGGYFPAFFSNGIESMRIATTRNVLIGTTTDAGYKLDVNGAFRSTNDATINTITVGLGGGANAENMAIGYSALQNNTTASDVTAVGYQALLFNTTGSSNSAFGYHALRSNTTGISNTALGRKAAYKNTNGTNNIALGQNSLYQNISGSYNTGLGFGSLQLTTSSNNTSIGYYAGFNNTTGENNIFIGYQADGVLATESNRTWIGNSSTTSTWLGGNLLIGTTTDSGYKLDVNGTLRVSGISYLFTGTNISSTGSNDCTFSIVRPISGSTLTFTTRNNSSTQTEGVNITRTDNTWLKFIRGTTVDFNISNSGNFLINTTTDSGYKLNVNGTSRISGEVLLSSFARALTIRGNTYYTDSSLRIQGYYSSHHLISIEGTGASQTGFAFNYRNDGVNLFRIGATGDVLATSFIKSGGTASEFLKADGSVDTNTYLTSYTETQTLDDVTTLGNTTTNSLVVGGLTVDTDTLYVDSANDRVGVGTTSPSYTLDVGGTIRTTGTAFFDNNVSIGTTDTGYTLRVNGNMLAGGMQFQSNVINASNVTISTITNGGNGNVNMRFFDGAWRDVLFFSNYQYSKNLILCGTGTYTGYNTIVGGTTNDGNKFQVKGGASVTGDLTLGGGITASSLTSAEGASLLYYDSSTGAVSQSVDPMHNWEWKWIRYSGAINPAGSTSTNFTDWYNTYFLRPTEATNTTYPIAASGYINTKTNVAADGGFGGSGVGNLSGDINYYHALIFTHIYVEESFTISATLIGDDPFAMFINGIFVTGRTSCCTGMPYTYTFSPGWYRIDLIYSENVGGDYIKMGWNPADYLDKIKYMNPHHIGQLTSYTFDEVNLATLNATSSIKLSTGDATTPAKLSINNPSGNNSTGTAELHFTHSNNLNGAKIVGGRDNVYGGSSGTWRGNLQFFTSTYLGGYNSDPAMRIDVFDNIITYAGVLRVGTSSNSGEKLQVSGTARITSNTSIEGVLTATAGAKLVVQNGTDGGNSRGILLWTNTDTNWGIYMGQAGSGKSLSGGTATASIDGRTSHAARFRVSDSTTHSFIWENRQEIALMSLTGDTGNLYTRGGAYFGTNSGNVTIGSTTNAGYKLDVNGSINSSTGYHINGVEGYTGTVNIDQSHIGLPPIQIEINGGIITNVI